MVVQQSVGLPKDKNKSQTAKSKAAKVNPGAVARGDAEDIMAAIAEEVERERRKKQSETQSMIEPMAEQIPPQAPGLDIIYDEIRHGSMIFLKI